MMNLASLIKKQADRIDAMTLRERVLIFLAAASVLTGWSFNSLIAPLLLERSNRLNQIEVAQTQMNAWNAQIATLARAKAAARTDDAKRLKLQDMQEEIAELDRRIAERGQQLVPPDRMGALLAGILRRNPNLQLGALTTLPATLMEGSQGQGGTAMYRHGIELSVSGSYLDIVDYLSALERLPAKVFWGGIDLSAAYPVTTLKISLYTYSPDKVWLSL